MAMYYPRALVLTCVVRCSWYLVLAPWIRGKLGDAGEPQIMLIENAAASVGGNLWYKTFP